MAARRPFLLLRTLGIDSSVQKHRSALVSYGVSAIYLTPKIFLILLLYREKQANPWPSPDIRFSATIPGDRCIIVGRMFAVRAALTLCLLSCALAAQAPNPFAKDPAAAEIGRGVFRIYCAPCHGIHAQGGRGPDLSHGVFHAGEHDGDIYRTISQGVPGTEMESYAGTLTDDNIWRIVTYLRSLPHAGGAMPVRGDAMRGEALFRGKGQCSSCHGVDGRNSSSGPDLSRIGRQRSLENLRESIIDPSAEIDNAYRRVTVVTREGAKITGLERGMDNFSVQLSDLSGKFYSFDKDQLRSVKRETESLMPGNYGKLLDATELDDLLAYLSTLRGERAP